MAAAAILTGLLVGPASTTAQSPWWETALATGLGAVVGGLIAAAGAYQLDRRRTQREERTEELAAQAASRFWRDTFYNAQVLIGEAIADGEWWPDAKAPEQLGTRDELKRLSAAAPTRSDWAPVARARRELTFLDAARKAGPSAFNVVFLAGTFDALEAAREALARLEVNPEHFPFEPHRCTKAVHIARRQARST